MSLTQEQRQQVEAAFTATVKRAFEKLHGLSLEERAINPFLVLVARVPVDLAEFIVWQRLERGFVTSLGMRFQKVADIVSPHIYPSGAAGVDLEGRDDDSKEHYLLQVKSGPDTIDKDLAEAIAAKLQGAENRIKSLGQAKGWVVVKMLGMCYGQHRHRSSWVLGLKERGVDVDRIGRRFWEFVAAEPNAYKEVFDVALNVATTYRNASNKTLPEAIHDAIAALTREIEHKYSDGKGGIDWERLLEDNM